MTPISTLGNALDYKVFATVKLKTAHWFILVSGIQKQLYSDHLYYYQELLCRCFQYGSGALFI